MRLPIPRLVRDVCDNYEIAPSQLIPNTWRILLALESLSMQHRVECDIGEVLFSYNLKKHAIDKGRYQLITKVGRVPIITCLRNNDHSQKDRFFFVKEYLVYGLLGPGEAFSHWKATSKI